MRNKTRILSVLSIVLALLILGPYFIGIYFQRIYQQILDVYSTTQQLNIHIEKYERGWFSSQASLTIQISDPILLDYLNFSHEEGKVPQTPVRVDQRIYHGPLLYKEFYRLSTWFGLVSIHNKVQKTPDLDRIIESIESADFISFFGKYYKYFKLNDVKLVYPRSDTNIHIGTIEGYVWIWPKQKKAQTDFVLNELTFQNPDETFSIPDLNAHFEIDKKLWRGHDKLTISTLSLIEHGNETLYISDIKVDWASEVKNQLIRVSKKIDISQISLLGYTIGPFNLMLSAHDLNASAIEDMINAYQLIRTRGELYQSQLIQKMVMMLPGVFNKGTTISLDKFYMRTEDGDVDIKGDMTWDLEKDHIPDQLPDIIAAANISLDLMMHKALVKKWISIASTLPWFNQESIDLVQLYQITENLMLYTKQYHEMGIHDLIASGKLNAPDGNVLIEMVRYNSPSSDYYFALRGLLLNKKISLETAHKLLYLYTQSQGPIEDVRKLLQENQNKISEDMMSQVHAWIAGGYIKENGDNYTVSFQQKNHKLTFNGILLH